LSDKTFIISEQMNDYKFISESIDNTKCWYLDGVFGEAELVNVNQRKYPLQVMTESVEEIQPFLNSGKILGEYYHPKSDKINTERACIQLEKLCMEGNKMMGRAKVLRGTILGNHLIGLLENGIQMPVSTRALGKVVDFDNYLLVEKMKLVTVDVVDNQSCPTAVPNALFESVNWMREIGSIDDREAELLESIKNTKSSYTFESAMRSTNNNILKGLDNVVLRACAKLGFSLS